MIWARPICLRVVMEVSKRESERKGAYFFGGEGVWMRAEKMAFFV